MLGDVNQVGKGWITDQYDRFVRGNTALSQPDDAGVIRVDETTGRGVALSTDANGWYTKLDPYAGAQQALAESYRNVCTVGATPLAVTDCLNFGNPEDPDAMWQLVTAMTGLADGCKEMGIPVTGGNVSLYNSSGTVKGTPTSSINPTPVVGVLGVTRGLPSSAAAVSRTASGDCTSLTPPALPRPPEWICAFTTQASPPRVCAAAMASSGLWAAIPRGVLRLAARRICLAWYSCRFMNDGYGSSRKRAF